MKYDKIVEGLFKERPNRFIAKVVIDGREETVHVKNTGRCQELLRKDVRVFLSDEEGKERKTRYDLIAVEKNNRIVNMDSQAPNAAVKEALQQGLILRETIEIKPELFISLICSQVKYPSLFSSTYFAITLILAFIPNSFKIGYAKE